MSLSKSTITLNGTEYIPAKEAEVGFLVALVGIVSGIVFGFIVLKAYFNLPFIQPIPQTYANPQQNLFLNETIPVENRDLPMYNFSEDPDQTDQGLVDITV